MSQLWSYGRYRCRRTTAVDVSRLRRFPENRFVGRRDEMLVYDCDDPEEYVVLAEAISSLDLDLRNLLQAFAPDTLAEARNRGFLGVTADS